MASGFQALGPTPGTWLYGDQGKYFTATNPTPGTGIISGVVTALADTTPLLLVKNNNTVASGIKIYPDKVKLMVSVVGIGHTVPTMAFKVDSSQSTARYTSGGSAITPQNVNADSATASAAQIYFGAITAAAAGSARLLGSERLKGAIEVVLDTFFFDFGAPLGQAQNGLVDNSTTISHGHFHLPPVVIGPQEWFAMHYFGASMSTGTTFTFNFGYIEV